VQPGGTVVVTAKFKAEGAKASRTSTRIHVSGFDFTGQTADSLCYEFVGESVVPGINASDWLGIFEEQGVVNSLADLAAAVDVVVHQSRFADGTRRIVSIMEVTGIEAGRVQMQPIFEFRARHGRHDARIDGVFSGCDAIPSFYDSLRESGMSLDLSPFARVRDGA
jgi:hypothetical protein